jgi:hypothetical protein
MPRSPNPQSHFDRLFNISHGNTAHGDLRNLIALPSLYSQTFIAATLERVKSLAGTRTQSMAL